MTENKKGFGVFRVRGFTERQERHEATKVLTVHQNTIFIITIELVNNIVFAFKQNLICACFFYVQEKLERLQESSSKPQFANINKMDKTEIAFKLADKDNDGYIDRSEFEKMAKNLSKEKAGKVFEKCDKNGDGRIDFSEFETMMNMNKKK